MSIRPCAAVGAILVLIANASFAQNPQGCASAQFSDDVLSRFPRAPEACLDVISRDGQDYAVFNARLTQVRGNVVRVRFRHPDGTFGPSSSITVPRDFRVLIDGEPTRIRDLATHQDLKAYVQVSRPMLALEPGDTGQRLLVVPLVAEEAVAEDGASDSEQVADASEPTMPATAGPAPLFAAVGLLFACAALGMRAVRGVRSFRRRRIERIMTLT